MNYIKKNMNISITIIILTEKLFYLNNVNHKKSILGREILESESSLRYMKEKYKEQKVLFDELKKVY